MIGEGVNDAAAAQMGYSDTLLELLDRAYGGRHIRPVTPTPRGERMDIYDRLGVRKVINGYGLVTTLGGSLMPAEAYAAA